MQLTLSLKTLKQSSLHPTPSYARYTYIRFLYLLYFINFLSAELFDLLEKKCIEVAENHSQEFLLNLEKETSIQCAFLGSTTRDIDTIIAFYEKFITFLNNRFPKNKLSLCLIYRSTVFTFHAGNLVFLKKLLLKDNNSEKDIINDSLILVKDIKSLIQETKMQLIKNRILKHKYYCNIFIYEFNCIKDNDFLLSQLFNNDYRDFNIHVNVNFYIAMQNISDIVEEFNLFKKYLDECKFGLLPGLKGKSLKLVKSSNSDGNYDFIEGKLEPGSLKFTESTLNLKEYVITRRTRNATVKKNFVKETEIDYPYVNRKIYLTLYDKTDVRTIKKKEAYEIKYDIKSWIEFRVFKYNPITLENYLKFFYFAAIGEPILFDKIYYQKIMVLEYGLYKDMTFFTFVACPNQETTSNNMCKESLQITKIFNDSIHFIFDALLKCRKCLNIEIADHLYWSKKPWLFNEMYLFCGKRIKYNSLLPFKEIISIQNKLSRLSNKLAVLGIEVTTIKLNFKTKYDSFSRFNEKFEDKCKYYYNNIAISDALKTKNLDNFVLGIKGTIKKGDLWCNFYLYIIPEAIFEAKKYLFKDGKSFEERICNRLKESEKKLESSVSEKIQAYLNDQHFKDVMRTSLYNTIYLTDDIQKKEYIISLVKEAFLKIATKLDYDNDICYEKDASTLKLMHDILTEVIFDEIQVVIEKFSGFADCLKCIVNLESDGLNMTEEDGDILKIIEEVFPVIDNSLKTY